MALTGRWGLFRSLWGGAWDPSQQNQGKGTQPVLSFRTFRKTSGVQDPGIISSAICQVAGEPEDHGDLLFIHYAPGTV